MNPADLSGVPPYRTPVRAEWIDYNGHLRDAFYGLILSLSIDELMDHLGLDAAYRESTRCTLYTLEQHIHFLHEVKASDELAVRTTVLDSDRKRLHIRSLFECTRLAEPVAAAETLLLHVRQDPAPAAAPFPVEIEERLAVLKGHAGGGGAGGTAVPGSRKIEIRRR